MLPENYLPSTVAVAISVAVAIAITGSMRIGITVAAVLPVILLLGRAHVHFVKCSVT